MLESQSLYSRSPQEFLERFDRRMDKEQESLWVSDFQFDDLSQERNERLDKAIETSDLQRELFLKEQQRFESFDALIPEIQLSTENSRHKLIIEELTHFIDYAYCLHGYYGFTDRLKAKVRGIFQSFKTRYL